MIDGNSEICRPRFSENLSENKKYTQRTTSDSNAIHSVFKSDVRAPITAKKIILTRGSEIQKEFGRRYSIGLQPFAIILHRRHRSRTSQNCCRVNNPIESFPFPPRKTFSHTPISRSGDILAGRRS